MMQAVDVVRRYMSDNNFGLSDGAVYKKAPDSSFTFIFCSTVKCFLLKLLGNFEIAEQIVTFIPTLTSLLSDSNCRLIKPISIDYNYIECLPRGTCFNIEKKCFEVNPINLKGSPRAFVLYEFCEDRTPNPEPFVEGL